MNPGGVQDPERMTPVPTLLAIDDEESILHFFRRAFPGPEVHLVTAATAAEGLERVTLDRPDLARRLVRVTHPRKLPVVLSPDEVARLLNATTCLKHQAALSVAYGAGLRVAEVSSLKVSDVDSERMLLRVERGKGGQYRNAMLSADMLALLRQWWKAGRRQGTPA